MQLLLNIWRTLVGDSFESVFADLVKLEERLHAIIDDADENFSITAELIEAMYAKQREQKRIRFQASRLLEKLDEVTS